MEPIPILIPNHYDISFDRAREVVTVKDDYGEFIPFPYQMWWHFVEIPYRNHFRHHGKSHQYVSEIFMREYRHRYICNN